MKIKTGLLLILLLSTFVRAQVVPPALVVEGEKEREFLSISEVTTDVKIYGPLAETAVTMTFSNPHERQLAGDLYFPVPEGATVSGYALDIEGVMVDGVVVEREKGRIVFEKIVRQGIDPGLIEWVKGNNFRTRVFPIPAHGSRRIRVKYISALTHKDMRTLYYLPLKFKEEVKEFSLRIEVIKAVTKPVIVEGGPEGLVFNKWRESYVADISLKNAQLSEDLYVALPDIDKLKSLVEKGSDKDFYFFLNDFVADAAQKGERKSRIEPENLTIFWDNSGSRGGSDHKKELNILKEYFSQKSNKTVTVNLVFFSNEKAESEKYAIVNGRAERLLETIERASYDGGTQMGALSPSESESLPDFYLLFTDGLSNFGQDVPGDLGAPVYIFSDDSQSDHMLLRFLAFQTGGEYFNLATLDVETVVSRIGVSPFSFISATYDNEKISDVYPKTPQPVQEAFMISGKLHAEKADIVLNYGRNNQITKKVKFTLSKEEASEGDLLRVFWAQNKIHDLMIFQEKNAEELTSTGKKYGLVTPGTSLIVLDNLEQYVEHEIIPPETLPNMRREYWKIIEGREAQLQKSQNMKIEQVLKLWNEKIMWWEKNFEYPKNFKYTEKRGTGDTAGRRGAVRLEAAAPPPQAARIEEASADESEEANQEASGPTISLKEWDPDTPYLKELKKAEKGEHFSVYMQQKKTHGSSPAFFLDCADFFFKDGQKKTGLRVLSNIAELELENAQLLRVLAHRLSQLELLDTSAYIFEKVLKWRPEEPQSYRDLALVLARQKKYGRAVELLNQIVLKSWDRFEEIELIALLEINNIMAAARREGVTELNVDPRFIKLLDVDIRIILTWDTDLTDMDLWVLEPSGEKAFYGHKLTTIGGFVSRDFTQGYGPEEYLLKKTMPGKYEIQANYFGSRAQSLVGAVTLQVEIFTNYGRENEERKSITLRLTKEKEVITIGDIEIK